MICIVIGRSSYVGLEPTGRARRAAGWRNPPYELRFVIASAAKQSILPLRGDMDCFASLAMTGLDIRATQYPRSTDDRTEKPRRTGSPAFAGDDTFCTEPHRQRHCEERLRRSNRSFFPR